MPHIKLPQAGICFPAWQTEPCLGWSSEAINSLFPLRSVASKQKSIIYHETNTWAHTINVKSAHFRVSGVCALAVCGRLVIDGAAKALRAGGWSRGALRAPQVTNFRSRRSAQFLCQLPNNFSHFSANWLAEARFARFAACLRLMAKKGAREVWGRSCSSGND